ncbi:HNH endonuclease [Geotalea sp. SG265]|uniref:HNH endonuclease n=1 Tax=Geotalea sp. SG265 TaxID=2922867 RepID=UPI001FAFF153|nr:HNH endonuclease [Geotalea sp. SG265]
MEYIKVYKTKVPNAAITLDRMIQLASAFSKIRSTEIRTRFSKLLDHEKLNFWDFGVKATAALNKGDSVNIICGSKGYLCQIIEIIKDPNGELGDIFGWTRMYDAPYKNVCALTIKSAKQLSPIEIKQLLSNSKQLVSSFYSRGPSQTPRKPEALSEGRVVELSLTTFERNPAARKSCLDHFGPQCRVCEFDFEKNYGELGKGFIHVHHITPLSHIRENYAVDPIKDLIPVCPNCHAMLHIRQGEPLTVSELKTIYSSTKA